MTQEAEVKSLIDSLPKQIEVVGGQDISGNPNIINSPVMQFVMLASIASQAVKIRKYFDDRESRGWVQNFNNIPVTAAVPSLKVDVDRPAQSISLTNDGPGIVWVEWNRRHSTPTILNPRETCNINFETHKLGKFFLQCPPGVVSTIRAVAKG